MRYAIIPALITLILMIASCGKEPQLCYLISPDTDTFHVNQQVIFNAQCTKDAKSFTWSFSDDSIYWDPYVSRSFADTGSFTAELVCTNGHKVSSVRIPFVVIF